MNGPLGAFGVHAADEPVGTVHGDAADGIIAEVLGDLDSQMNVVLLVLKIDGAEQLG